MSDPLALEREAQTLRLELEAAREEIGQLQEALDKQRARGESRVSEAVSTIQMDLMTHLAAPMAQLMTQNHLFKAEGKEVATRDVLSVAHRVARTLEDAGLCFEGTIGASIPFNPDQHEPLGDFHPSAGDTVVLRVVGVSFQGQRLRRAGVVQS